MSERIDLRKDIEDALRAFGSTSLPVGAKRLFSTLGYASQRKLPIATAKKFCEQLDPGNKLTDKQRESLSSLKSLHLLFQLTDAELSNQRGLFDDPNEVNATQIESYLFFAAELPSGHYTRTTLSTIVRAINKPLPMPALVLFRHGDTTSIGIIHRRLHKRDQSKDVLEKVTLIKDIDCDDPIRAHLEILNDFTLANLNADFGVSNFVRLHEAWQKRLGSYALSNEFYREIADWYFWAHHQVEDGTIRLPQHCDTEQEQSLFLIRTLTRVIFCWFLVEKRLIPSDLFREHWLSQHLKAFTPSRDPTRPDTSPTYYHAILQNLFFGTLNMPPEQRAFREKKKDGQRYDKNFGITNLWRYQSDFRDASEWIAICKRIPFLNGGLFDCLDDKTGGKSDNFILDGFSDNPKLGCDLPNDLFFGPERTVDLSHDYGEDTKKTARSKKAKVRGLIEILSRYKFTVEENTPLEEEIALDPELLGKVFENLLASYNEDTRTTARKALGAFYTPREIVNYMVDEALKSYLGSQVPRCKGALEDLFSNKATLKEIKPDTRDALIAAIGRVKVLDPACGSGAFPMGALHRLVDLLQKLDPNNESWKRDRLAEAHRFRELLESTGAKRDEIDECDARMADIEKSFDTRYHALDFARKLYLIENCIYGVDIQPMATQIAKLRFFISLVVDQKVEPSAPNLGVRPLPNLETRLVAADTLIPIEKTERDLFSSDLDRLRAELADIRHQHFNARSPAGKRKWRVADEAKRHEIADKLEGSHALSKDAARKLAAWDPYDQNTSAPFFDSEWMFGLPVGKVRLEGKAPFTFLGNLGLINEASGQSELTATAPQEVDSGFDVVIGNPPYVRQESIKHLKEAFRQHYECFTGTADLYVYFYEAGIKLLREGGSFSFITSNKWFRSGYGEKLRGWLTKNTRVLQLIDFGDAPVFTAIAYPTIVILQRSEPTSDGNIRALTWEPGPPIETFAEVMARKSFALPQKELKADGWRLETGTSLRLLEQLRAAGKPLGEYVNGRFYRGVLTGLNEAFVVDRATRDRLIAEHPSSEQVLKPFLRGRDVKRWRVDFEQQYLIKIESSENFEHHWSGMKNREAEAVFAKTFPAIHRHFEQYRAAMEARCDQGQYFWELRSCAYWQEFEHNKVLYPDIYEHQSFTWDAGGHYAANTCYFIPTTEKWLTALLNSSTVEWFYGKVSNRVRGGYLRAFSDYMRQIPIPPATDAQQKRFEMLVDAMLHLNRHFAATPAEQTTRDPLMQSYMERLLNGLVYELYFSQELHAAGLRLFDLVAQVKLPNLEKFVDAKKLPVLRELFQDLYDPNHPVRIALDKLQTLDVVRIIEGKT
jgi:adenine-specific DNA-methyltransferase